MEGKIIKDEPKLSTGFMIHQNSKQKLKSTYNLD